MYERNDVYLLQGNEISVSGDWGESTDSDIYFGSKLFLETVFNEIRETFRYVILDIIRYVYTQNNKVPYHKKQVIFHTSISSRSYRSKHETSLYYIFHYLLQQEVSRYLVELDTSMWHFFLPVIYEDILKGASLKLERKSILSNMSLALVLLKENNNIVDSGNGPTWNVVGESLKLGSIPGHILYFGRMHRQVNKQRA